MAKISYDFGHMEGGQDTSARGFLYEYRVNRDYGRVVVSILARHGFEMINCTPADGTGLTLGQSLAYRANKANQSGSILHICMHANSFGDPAAHGSEICVASDAGARIAQPVLAEILALGYTNRGIKRPSLYMTSRTNMPCILPEPFFVSNQGDCNLYDPVKLGTAIAKGVLRALGVTYIPELVEVQPTPQPTQPTPSVNQSALAIQQKLNRLKIRDDSGSTLVEDGILGARSTQAIKRFQSICGISVDGIWGSQSEGCYAAIVSKPLCSVTQKPSAVVTRYIQFRVGAGIDGIWGYGTDSCVKRWQSANSLSADGWVGNMSWGKLIG